MHKEALPCLALALLAACGAPPDATDAGSAAPRPEVNLDDVKWTNAFLEPANLVADEIAIEGPPALRNHVTVRQDSQGASYIATTTPKGFLQEVGALPEVGYVELHAQLDSWKIVAFRRITWLERPELGPVLIRASGGASWQGIESGTERRDEVLLFRGEIER